LAGCEAVTHHLNRIYRQAVYLLATRPIQEFTGHLASHELIVGGPAVEIVMRPAGRNPKVQIVRG
jgi:hypothetical protein